MMDVERKAAGREGKDEWVSVFLDVGSHVQYCVFDVSWWSGRSLIVGC